MNIHLNIDSLILDGIEISQRERPLLKTAVAAELARLLTEGGLSQQSQVALHSVPTGQIQLAPGNNPVQLGRQIANSVYNSVNQ